MVKTGKHHGMAYFIIGYQDVYIYQDSEIILVSGQLVLPRSFLFQQTSNIHRNTVQ